MTNEEAVKMLIAKVECMKRETSGIDSDCNDRYCDNCDLCYAQGTMGEQKEALRMAIEALEKQDVPEANVGDTISRQAAVDAADRADYTGLTVEDVKKVTDEVVKEIKKLPSAQAERETGQWLDNETTFSETGRQTATCSVCGLRSPRPLGEFCRWCGAQMTEVKWMIGQEEKNVK